MSRSSAKKKPSLSLTPEQEAFLNDPAEASPEPEPVPVPALAPPVAAPAKPTRARSKPFQAAPRPSAEEPQLGQLPRSHRLQSSGRVVRRVTGFVSFELGKRFEAYLETEERTASYVLERALKAWLLARQA